jgi:hypothetical protein
MKVKDADPNAKAVTTPVFDTEAMDEFKLVQVPPLDGDKVVFPLRHMLVDPVTETTGFAYTEIDAELKDEQPVVLFVNTNVVVPPDRPVTIPAFVMVATDGLLLTQVPLVEGVKVVV